MVAGHPAVAAGRRRGRDLFARRRRLLHHDHALDDRGLLLLHDRPFAHDLAFHRAIATATGNPSYLDVLDALGRKAIPCDVSSPDSTELVQDRDYQLGLQREHLAILNAISSRDSAGAREAMRIHLTNSQTRYRTRMYERQANYAVGDREGR